MKRGHFRDFKSQSVKQMIKSRYRSCALLNDAMWRTYRAKSSRHYWRNHTEAESFRESITSDNGIRWK